MAVSVAVIAKLTQSAGGAGGWVHSHPGGVISQKRYAPSGRLSTVILPSVPVVKSPMS